MSLLRGNGRRFASVAALASIAALAALALVAAAPASAANCPTFRVLHNDRIGPASLPAGNYEVTTEESPSCQVASQLFARFLQDWDGDLPDGWIVRSEGSGKASFIRKSFLESPVGFSVKRVEAASDGGNSLIGKLCPGTFTVNASTDVGPLSFPKGRYLLYIPAKSGIACRRASVLFTRFLASPEGQLPFPWRVKTQNATFYKPEHPLRSAFRVEPASGV